MNTFLLHLASVAVLVIAVEAACRLGRFRPAICHALWLVVLVKLIVPPVVAWPMSAEVLAAMLAAPVSNDAIAAGSTGGNTGRTGIMAGGWSFGLSDTEASPATDSGTASWVTPVSVMSGLWALGALAVVAWIAMHVYRGRRRIAAGEALPAWLQSQLAQSCALLGVPVPRAVVTRDPGGVYMQITGRPTLVISADTLEHVSADQWHTILTHELAHLKRRDHWVAWLMIAAGAVWWWNPCFWWVRNRIHLFSEMACDAWVVNIHPGDRRQYAETMVRIMAMLSRQDAPAPAMGLAAWSAATQERRLWMIMKAKGGCRVPWLGAVGVMAFAVLAAPSWIAESVEPTGKDSAASSGEADWIVYSEDGVSKPHAVELLPASTPLEHYKENLGLINPDFLDLRKQEVYCFVPGAYDPENITVTEIGPWHGYTVFDLANIPAKHRSIVLKDQQGNHRILYTQVCWGSATNDDTPHFVTVQDQTLLVYRSETGGSSGNCTEYYFLYDRETRRPVSLSLAPIRDRIAEIIPKNTHLYDAGGFDIAKLTYTNSVWREGDADCCSTGGSVTMKLEIRDKALVVTEAKYEPDPKAR